MSVDEKEIIQECGICFVSMDEEPLFGFTQCNDKHRLCCSCLTEHYKHSKTCPFDRTKITHISRHDSLNNQPEILVKSDFESILSEFERSQSSLKILKKMGFWYEKSLENEDTFFQNIQSIIVSNSPDFVSFESIKMNSDIIELFKRKFSPKKLELESNTRLCQIYNHLLYYKQVLYDPIDFVKTNWRIDILYSFYKFSNLKMVFKDILLKNSNFPNLHNVGDYCFICDEYLFNSSNYERKNHLFINCFEQLYKNENVSHKQTENDIVSNQSSTIDKYKTCIAKARKIITEGIKNFRNKQEAIISVEEIKIDDEIINTILLKETNIEILHSCFQIKKNLSILYLLKRILKLANEYLFRTNNKPNDIIWNYFKKIIDSFDSETRVNITAQFYLE